MNINRLLWTVKQNRFDWRFSCMDCGVNVAAIGEYFIVEHDVWQREAMLDENGGMMCIGCLEDRLGRMLSCLDFAICSCNTPRYWRESGRWPSERFAHRLKRKPTKSELLEFMDRTAA